MHPIGWVSTDRKEIKEDYWGGVTSTIKLNEEEFTEDILLGLDEFSHIEVVFFLNQVKEDEIFTGARHPRRNESFPKVGVFAQRVQNRPNRIGVSRCEVLKVDATRIHVKGLDAIDKTPVLDIKPLMRGFVPDKSLIQEPAWATELMTNYYKESKNA